MSLRDRRQGLNQVAIAYAAAFGAAAAAGYVVRDMHPIAVVAIADLVAVIVVFGFSVWRGNASFHDPYWSVVPPFIALYWMNIGVAGDDVLWWQWPAALLVAVWAVQLTGNWIDRWEGPGDEDFRYRDLHAKTGDAYPLANLLGIHLFPTAVVFAACLPLYPALANRTAGANWLDFIAIAVTASAIAVEVIADSQLRLHRRTGSTTEILDTGLWAFCRHPNYLGELGFWWGLYLFGLAANPDYWWTGVGALAMTGLFVIVTIPMMSKHLAERRPGYAEHMKRVPGLIPRPRRAA